MNKNETKGLAAMIGLALLMIWGIAAPLFAYNFGKVDALNKIEDPDGESKSGNSTTFFLMDFKSESFKEMLEDNRGCVDGSVRFLELRAARDTALYCMDLETGWIYRSKVL